ncbi:hypothetical protein D3C73_1667440 [compost metagenome]
MVCADDDDTDDPLSRRAHSPISAVFEPRLGGHLSTADRAAVSGGGCVLYLPDDPVFPAIAARAG